MTKFLLHHVQIVLIAFVTTTGVVGTVTVLALVIPFDMTKRGHILAAAGSMFFVAVRAHSPPACGLFSLSMRGLLCMQSQGGPAPCVFCIRMSSLSLQRGLAGAWVGAS